MVLWWKSYLGGYGEGAEFYELGCEGRHCCVLSLLIALAREWNYVVSVSMEGVIEVGAAT